MKKRLGIGCGAVVGLVVLLIIVAAAAGGSKTPATVSGSSAKASVPAASSVSKVGDVVSAGNWKYQITKTDRQKTITWSEFGNTTDAKGIFEIIYMNLTNIGNQTFPINSSDFNITDSAGVKYATDSTSSIEFSDYRKLANVGGNFPPNVPADSVLLFDVNPAATGLRLNLVQAKAAVDLGT